MLYQHILIFAFKHPHLFCKVVGMSGRYELGQQISHYSDLLQGHWCKNVYFNMPNQYIAGLDDPGQLHALRILDISFVVGRDDPFLGSNSYLSQVLHHKGINNTLYIWDDEAHRPRYWRKMVTLYL